MTRIRMARESDVVGLVEMGLQFLAESSYRDHLTPDPLYQAQMARWLLAHGAVFVAEREVLAEGASYNHTRGDSPLSPCPACRLGTRLVGMVGMALVCAPLTGELTASEAMWWVDPVHRRGRLGIRLWDEAEAWAVGRGAVLIHMIAPAGADTVAGMYARRGYVALETTWQKRLAA